MTTPWNKGLDQRTGLPVVKRSRNRWNRFKRGVLNALRGGYLVRPSTCPVCQRQVLVRAFPADGDNVYIVKWFCVKCQPKGDIKWK